MIRTITELEDIEQFVGCRVAMTVSNHSRTFEPYHGVVGKVGETIYTMTRVGETTPMWSVDLNKPRFKKHIKQIEFHVMELAK